MDNTKWIYITFISKFFYNNIYNLRINLLKNKLKINKK